MESIKIDIMGGYNGDHVEECNEIISKLHDEGYDEIDILNHLLIFASTNGYLGVVKWLVQNGADVTINNNEPLVAAVNNNVDKEVIDFLVICGVAKSN